MAEFLTDMLGQILMRLDVADLIRCKNVCKSWRSLISGQTFIKKHMNYNSLIGHEKRIVMTKPQCEYKSNKYHFQLLGSSNGLICIYLVNVEVLVVNLFTSEMRRLPKPIINDISSPLCWGFGYDSSTDDYKVILGLTICADLICFQVLSLRSNVWKFVGEVKYNIVMRIGTFCSGALHWFMSDENKKKVILSFDLSRERFKEIPQPDDSRYRSNYDHSRLGIIQDNLCIYGCLNPAYHKWIMKNYNVKQSWEFLPYIRNRDDNATSYLKDHLPYFRSCGEVGIWFSLTIDDITAPIFVPSLVSPHVRGRLERKRNREALNTT